MWVVGRGPAVTEAQPSPSQARTPDAPVTQPELHAQRLDTSPPVERCRPAK